MDDGYGNLVGDWVDLCAPRPCTLTPTTARQGEEVMAMRAQGNAQYDCWLRFDSETATITPDDRAIDALNPHQTYNITFAGDMDGSRTWILLQLKKGGADG